MAVFGEALIIITNVLLEVTPFMMVLTAFTMLFMSFGIVALAMGLGAMYPDFKIENIAQVATGFGGVLYMIISSLFTGLVIVLEAGPVYTIFMSQVRHTPVSVFQWIFILVSFLAVLTAVSVAVFMPLRLGIRALDRHE
jgi:ABC-2 type transport system permease protein